MPQRSAANAVLVATFVSGTLDIAFAALLSLVRGHDPGAMLRYVASGPFPAATEWGGAGSALGLAVHFTLMAVMVAAFVLAARTWPALLERPVVSGIVYGLATYVAMNLVVLPLRFSAAFPPAPMSVATQLFAHIALVGIPLSLIVRRYLRPSI